MRPFIRTAAVAALAFGLAQAAVAGPQYLDASGYAASGYDVVAYFDKTQSPVGSRQPAPTPGRAAITAEHNGARFAFATEESRARFLADPARFAPQYDGHCAYGVAKGGKVPGDPALWRIVDDRLYLNVTPNVVGFWEEDIPGNIALAESNWPGIESEDASDRAVQNLDPAAAPLAD
jgi:hypothetical protein